MSDQRPDDAVARALAKIPSGTSVATATHDGKSTGMLASWIQQVAFEPPMLCLAVKKGRPIESLIDQGGTFVLNLIGQEQTGIFQHFSRAIAPSESAFGPLAVEYRQAGPVLTECIGHLACRVTAKHEAGDHFVYLAEVTAGTAEADAKPHIHVRNTGRSY